jgi:O-antigen/teichoic acid export membrane protein
MLKSTGTVLARNALYNFITQIVVSIVAFVSIPIIVRGMGEEAFGVLTLIWMVVGYFSILDLGVGQASVKFLAEQLARNEKEEANSTVWVSVGVSVAVGLFTSLVIALSVPFFVSLTDKIPSALLDETRRSSYWVTIAIPFVMVQGAFRAVPMAVQRFDLFNLMTGLSGLLQWGGSLVLVLMGMGLFEVVMLTVIIRVVGAVVAFLIAMKLFPELSFRRVHRLKETAKTLLKFGGWLTVSQAVSPVTRYLDRVFVVSYHSLKMFTFYSVPYEAISRLQLIPMSLSTTLYPALAERGRGQGESQAGSLYWRAMNFTFLVMLPASIVLAVFSSEILQLWLGGDFPTMSEAVFALLAIAAFIQAVGYVPLTALQALGRPDLATKFYLAEIPLYVLLCFMLVPSFGIEGAAWAWLIRISISSVWLLWASHRAFALRSETRTSSSLVRALLLNGLLLICLVVVERTVGTMPYQILASSIVVLTYAVCAWMYCLDSAERNALHQLTLGKLGIRSL